MVSASRAAWNGRVTLTNARAGRHSVQVEKSCTHPQSMYASCCLMVSAVMLMWQMMSGLLPKCTISVILKVLAHQEMAGPRSG